jgi:hypothetical protein
MNELSIVYLCAVSQAVTATCLKVLLRPLIYFSEADIQQLLVEELRHAFRNQKGLPGRGKDLPTKVKKGFGAKGEGYKTSLIHREYGGGGRKRIDVVVFHPDEIRLIDNANLTRKSRYLKAFFAFELGTEKSATSKDKAADHFLKDLEKLKDRCRRGEEDQWLPNGTGYVLQFYKYDARTQKYARADAKARKTLNKIKETRQAIKETWHNWHDGSDDIRVVAISINLGTKDRNNKGKCRLLGKDRWDEIGIKDEHRWAEAILENVYGSHWKGVRAYEQKRLIQSVLERLKQCRKGE